MASRKLQLNDYIIIELCPWTKLTAENVKYIRSNSNITIKELANQFNVSEATIRDILSNRTWKGVEKLR